MNIRTRRRRWTRTTPARIARKEWIAAKDKKEKMDRQQRIEGRPRGGDW